MINLCDFIGDEVVRSLHRESVLTGLMSRRISSPTDDEYVWPEHQLWTTFEILKEQFTYEQLSLYYLNPCIATLVRSADTFILKQLVTILQTTRQIIPSNIVGIQHSVDWMQEYWRQQRTKSEGRCFIVSPGCEVNLLRSSIQLPNWFYMSMLEDHVIAFQKDALTYTSIQLKPIVEADTYYVLSRIHTKG